MRPRTKKRLAWLCAGVAGAAAFVANMSTVLSGLFSVCDKAGLCGPAPEKILVRLANLDLQERAKLIYGPPAPPPNYDINAIAYFQPYSSRHNEFCLAETPMSQCRGNMVSREQFSEASDGFDCEHGPFQSAWAPGIPVFDLIAGSGGRLALIAQLRVEAELVELDHTPYVSIESTSHNLADVQLVQQSDDKLAKVTLDYDIVSGGQQVAADKSSRFHHALDANEMAALGRHGVHLSLLEPALRAMPALKLVASPTWPGRQHIAGVPKGGVWAVGRLDVLARDGREYNSHFRARLWGGDPPEFGGTGVQVDYSAVVVLDPDHKKSAIVKDLAVQLLPSSPTLRGHVALVSKKSAIYNVRFSYFGLSDTPIMRSGWFRVQTFTSPWFASQYFLGKCWRE